MDPIGGLKGNFQPYAEGYRWNAAKADDKERRSVGGICETVVQTAMIAAGFQGQEPVEQFALTTARAEALHTGSDGRKRGPFFGRRRTGILDRHDRDSKKGLKPIKEAQALKADDENVVDCLIKIKDGYCGIMAMTLAACALSPVRVAMPCRMNDIWIPTRRSAARSAGASLVWNDDEACGVALALFSLITPDKRRHCAPIWSLAYLCERQRVLLFS